MQNKMELSYTLYTSRLGNKVKGLNTMAEKEFDAFLDHFLKVP